MYIHAYLQPQKYVYLVLPPCICMHIHTYIVYTHIHMNTGLHNFLYSLPMYFIHIFIGLCFMYLFGLESHSVVSHSQGRQFSKGPTQKNMRDLWLVEL